MGKSTPPDDREPAEDGASKIFVTVSQRLSRRKFIARAGTFVVTLVGTSAAIAAVPGLSGEAWANSVPGLGYDPSTWHNCDKWARCNMCGYSCNCCNGDENNPGACPGCAEDANFWEGCCTNDSGDRKLVRYWDCRRGSCDNTKIAACYQCSGCNNGCPQPFWKATGQQYVCTAVRIIGTAC